MFHLEYEMLALVNPQGTYKGDKLMAAKMAGQKPPFNVSIEMLSFKGMIVVGNPWRDEEISLEAFAHF